MKKLNFNLKKNNFKIVVPVYNAEEYIGKCLDSIKNQTYRNFECIIVSDASTDKTNSIIEDKIKGDSRFKVIYQSDRKYALYNTILGTNSICKDDNDIIVIVDGDDWLYDNDALDYLNFVYQDSDVWVTYGQYMFANGYIGLCKEDYLPFLRYDYHRRNPSHLRTYKYFLFKQIKHTDFLDSNNNFLSICGDMAIMYPICEMSGNHIRYISKLLYVYNNLNPLNDYKINENKQVLVDTFLNEKEPYPLFENLNSPLVVDLYDSNFKHSINSGADYVISKYIQWNRDNAVLSNFVIYTDLHLSEVRNNDDRIKIGWLLEPMEINSSIYEYIKTNYYKFDIILTHNEDILKLIPNAYFIPASQTWIKPEDWQLYNKSKNISLIASNQTVTDGHKLRHEIIKNYSNRIDCVCGKGYSTIDYKLIGLKDFRFNFAIQNDRHNFYFTEHLIGCFLTGTIPIFWGCEKIYDFFNKDGILFFNNIAELNGILNKCNEKTYNDMLLCVRDNFNRAHKYILTENYIYNMVFRRLLCGSYLR